MGKKVYVKLHGKSNDQRGIKIDANATEGAVVGQNLKWSDGTPVQESQIRNTAGGSSSSSTTVTGGVWTGATIWSLIVSIPAIIKSLAALATKGWIRNDAGVISASQWAYNKLSVDTGEEMTIPAGHELIVFQNFTIDGAVTLDGDLVVLE